MTNIEKNEAVARKLGWTYDINPSPNGFHWVQPSHWKGFPGYWPNVPNYCTDIRAAWGLINHALKAGWRFHFRGACDPKSYFFEFWKNEEKIGFEVARCEEAPTAPMAIVDAFLKLP